jgi:hypothetical protein
MAMVVLAPSKLPQLGVHERTASTPCRDRGNSAHDSVAAYHSGARAGCAHRYVVGSLSPSTRSLMLADNAFDVFLSTCHGGCALDESPRPWGRPW